MTLLVIRNEQILFKFFTVSVSMKLALKNVYKLLFDKTHFDKFLYIHKFASDTFFTWDRCPMIIEKRERNRILLYNLHTIGRLKQSRYVLSEV